MGSLSPTLSSSAFLKKIIYKISVRAFCNRLAFCISASQRSRRGYHGAASRWSLVVRETICCEGKKEYYERIYSIAVIICWPYSGLHQRLQQPADVRYMRIKHNLSSGTAWSSLWSRQASFWHLNFFVLSWLFDLHLEDDYCMNEIAVEYKVMHLLTDAVPRPMVSVVPWREPFLRIWRYRQKYMGSVSPELLSTLSRLCLL